MDSGNSILIISSNKLDRFNFFKFPLIRSFEVFLPNKRELYLDIKIQLIDFTNKFNLSTVVIQNKTVLHCNVLSGS